MQCSAQDQAVRHHPKSTDGAARHAGCSGPMRPCVTARRCRQGSVGQVRECTGPAMPQHTYAQRAHNTHSPARLPVPVGRHPDLCHLVIAPSAPHHTTHHTPHHTTPHHTTPHHKRAKRAKSAPIWPTITFWSTSVLAACATYKHFKFRSNRDAPVKPFATVCSAHETDDFHLQQLVPKCLE